MKSEEKRNATDRSSRIFRDGQETRRGDSDQGKKEPPAWVKKMVAIRRKTLFVCDACHQKIHAGTYDQYFTI